MNEQAASNQPTNHHNYTHTHQRPGALDWKDVAAQTNVPASTLTRLGQGKKPSADNLAALIEWSGLDMRDYIRLAPMAQEGE